jgi:hypothetical protein
VSSSASAAAGGRLGTVPAEPGQFGRYQLDRQRQLVELHADRGHGGSVLRRDLRPRLRRAPAEQLDRVGQPQRADRHRRLARHP